MAISWSDELDVIFDAEHAVMLAYVTPASGVVMAPVSNFGLHDRDAGILTVNTSVGAWKKVERIRRNPHVALAFHTRAHAAHDRSEYVLVQGRATVGPAVADYPGTVVDAWERFEPWRDVSPLWKRWQRIYALRVEIRIAIERIVVWPDLRCEGAAEVHGAPLPAEAPAPQEPPRKGTAPRVNARRAAKRAVRLPDVLLGWVGSDGFPVVVPVRVDGGSRRGIAVRTSSGLVPPGARRAGLTAHWFSRGVLGQRQRIHTGWMEAGDGGAVDYAPHTTAAYRMPTSRIVYRFAVGLFTRLRYRRAPRAHREATAERVESRAGQI
ncbi:MAG: pyridoxamine 5'-phosphate oxidase family protein [Thermoleophilaceae bacterium]